MDVIERVIFLNVSVTSSVDTMKRLFSESFVTAATLSVVESTPLPKTVVVVMKGIEEISGLYTPSDKNMRRTFVSPKDCALKTEVQCSLSSEQVDVLSVGGVDEIVLEGRNVYI